MSGKRSLRGMGYGATEESPYRRSSSGGFDDVLPEDDAEFTHGRKRRIEPPRRVMTDPSQPLSDRSYPGSHYQQSYRLRHGSAASSPPEILRSVQSRGREKLGSWDDPLAESSGQIPGPILQTRVTEQATTSSQRAAVLALTSMEAHAARARQYRQSLSPPPRRLRTLPPAVNP